MFFFSVFRSVVLSSILPMNSFFCMFVVAATRVFADWRFLKYYAPDTFLVNVDEAKLL